MCYDLTHYFSADDWKINNYIFREKRKKQKKSLKRCVTFICHKMEGLSAEVSEKIRAAISAKLVSVNYDFVPILNIHNFCFDILERTRSLRWRWTPWLHHGTCGQQKESRTDERGSATFSPSACRCFYSLAWRYSEQTERCY